MIHKTTSEQLLLNLVRLRYREDPLFIEIGNVSAQFVFDESAVAVRYRGYWFYIDDTDLHSKSTFALLRQLFSLPAGQFKGAAPVLTLPVGGCPARARRNQPRVRADHDVRHVAEFSSALTPVGLPHPRLSCIVVCA
ncbi:MAG: hypothetical protein JSV19_01855 [Phycisphaerales bacterium]|nr:MAG: hypothetical protein JSV19_01855 [Phycisphaerales bacterium]